MSQIRLHSSCDACLNTKVKCSQSKPICARCDQHGRKCIYSQFRKIGRPSSKTINNSPSQTPSRKSKGHTEARQKQLGPGVHRLLQPTVRSAVHETSDSLRCDQDDQDGHSSGTVEVSSRTHQGSSDFETLRVNKSPWLTDDVIGQSLQSALQSDVTANFSDDVECDTDGVHLDWSAIESLLDNNAPALPFAPSPVQNFASSVSLAPGNAQFYLEDTIVASVVSSAGESRQSPTTGARPVIPHQLPLTAIDGLALPGNEYFFKPGSFSTTNFEFDGSRTTPGQSSTASLSPRTPSVHTIQPNLYSISSSRCTVQCHRALTSQLTEISEKQVQESNVPLDILLRLDYHIRQTRERALSCSACLAGSRHDKTLMFITMVLSNLLSLFEQSCSAFHGDPQRGVNGRAGSLCGEANHATVANNHQVSPSPLPYTTRPLIVGSTRLAESFKLSFSRQLVIMYVNQQLEAVTQLGKMLYKVESDNIRAVSWIHCNGNDPRQ
ncbi:hypothetical protein JX266_003357 [Neoarthrinium moseri]|nr:hypothetical protein JX266_003357 [Neoarthrinium moseri]